MRNSQAPAKAESTATILRTIRHAGAEIIKSGTTQALIKGGSVMLTRWSDIDRMFGSMDSLRRKLDLLSGNFDRTYGYVPNWAIDEGVPKTNLYDNGDGFEIRAEIPGFSKEDLNVRIQGNYLEISGTRKQDAPGDYKVHRTERGVVNFSRSFTLPSDVDSSKVEASLQNGILVLTLPKAESAKPKQITVN